MPETTVEMMLSAAVIVLTIIAIAVFIISGAGVLFYVLFIVVVAVMLYNWKRISAYERTQNKAPSQGKAKVASKPRAKRRARGRA